MPSPTDDQLLSMIDRLRAEHHACSTGMLSLAFKVSKDHIVKRCDRLKGQGIVQWSANIGGSLCRVGTKEYVEERLPLDAVVPTAAPEPPVPVDVVATAPPMKVGESANYLLTTEVSSTNWMTPYGGKAAVITVTGLPEPAPPQPFFPPEVVEKAVDETLPAGTLVINGVTYRIDTDAIAAGVGAARGIIQEPDPNTGKPPRRPPPAERTEKAKGQHGSAYGGPKRERTEKQKAAAARFLAAGQAARAAKAALRAEARKASIERTAAGVTG